MIACNIMAELMKLSAEEKRGLASELMKEAGETTPSAVRKDISNLTDSLTEIDFTAHRTKAVAQSFAERYVDTTSMWEMVACSPEHFENLYNTLSYMICDLAEQTEEAVKSAEDIVHSMRKGL